MRPPQLAASFHFHNVLVSRIEHVEGGRRPCGRDGDEEGEVDDRTVAGTDGGVSVWQSVRTSLGIS